ncbi:uncharacterized protein NECHADRAFT_79475 [Fusarium vanettenii 77-13-4]|uniref:Uncharacterized protein n=1 Tax=Fusarium vanettenii (strain ATCC MYA-4622 / CBS 123669 / FGSC 9596 / NRRL 45880 / 77-13-4) TaxID=660122 RepID=C7YNZ2_FUSV7|nr:uncharacterized protein NECHADRAFT_79475 [Fusarium vanettenii 77-13-4]EEU46198.1 predicted protein [Fusarium vanettenii 77-13-4]
MALPCLKHHGSSAVPCPRHSWLMPSTLGSSQERRSCTPCVACLIDNPSDAFLTTPSPSRLLSLTITPPFPSVSQRRLIYPVSVKDNQRCIFAYNFLFLNRSHHLLNVGFFREEPTQTPTCKHLLALSSHLPGWKRSTCVFALACPSTGFPDTAHTSWISDVFDVPNPETLRLSFVKVVILRLPSKSPHGTTKSPPDSL